MGTGYTSFPTASTSTVPNNYFYIRDPADTTNEICQVQAGGGSTTSWTVLRGACSTTPVAHASGATWVQVISPGTLQNFKQASNAATSPVTLASATATETVLASYVPNSSDLEAGATFEVIAYGTLFWTTHPTLQLKVYWGGSGSPGSAFTATGSALLSMIKTATNSPALTPTTTTAGSGFSWDLNATITLLSTTTATCNMNMWYTGATLAAAGVSATTVNTSTAGLSVATAITVSGDGPIILTALWGTGSTSNSITATAPAIYRVA